MSFESEDALVLDKVLVNKSKSVSGTETEKAKPWLRSYRACSPQVDEVAATAAAKRTNKQAALVQVSTNSTMPKSSPTTSEGMKTRSGCKKQSKCPAASQGSKATCSETTTPPSDARITRAQSRRSMALDQSTTTTDTSEGTSQRQRRSRATTGKTYRSPSPRQRRGGRFLFTRKLHPTSKYHRPYNIHHPHRTHL